MSKPSRAMDTEVMHERAYKERVIDSDFHLHIPPDALYPFVDDDKIRGRLEKDGAPPIFSRRETGYSSYKKDTRPYIGWDRIHGQAATREEIREICDELAINEAVVQPGTNLELHRSHYPTVTGALAKAYNDFLMDVVIDFDDGIYGGLFLPHWDVDLALEELDRYGKEKGFVAAQNWMNCYKLWGDPEYDPIFEKLVDLDLNLILHTSGGGLSSLITPESIRTSTTGRQINYGYDCMANVCNMVMTGVFDKFPDLQVSMQEAGMDWIPWTAYRLTEHYQRSGPPETELAERFFESGRDGLERMPHEYVFDNFYTATQPVTYPQYERIDHIEASLKLNQAEKTFMYTSDWPHGGLDPVDWVFEYPCIDDDLRAQILHGNSAEFLRL